jgi:hypothetical protein
VNYAGNVAEAEAVVAEIEGSGVLHFCESERIGFIPWHPVATGELARPGGPLDGIAREAGTNPAALALAWLLRREVVRSRAARCRRGRHEDRRPHRALEQSSSTVVPAQTKRGGTRARPMSSVSIDG